MNRDAEHKSDSEWQACPSGEVAELVGRLRARRRHETFRQVALGTAALCLVLIAGSALIHRGFKPADPNFGGITCTEVAEHAEAYVAGTLDADLTQRIDMHLSRCPFCRDLIDQMKKQGETAPVARKETAQMASPLLVALSD